jgi:hypothetical protein
VKIAFLLLTILCSTNLLYSTSDASEIQWAVQNVRLRKQKQSGWQHDFFAKTSLAPKLDVGLEGSYIERFSLYDTTYGGMIGYHFNNKFYTEAHYTQGIGNQLLPERDTTLTSYYALVPGFSPYLTLRDSRYSDTKVQSATLGGEIEKWPHILIIPQVMLGKSKFKTDSSKESIYSYGFKTLYYTEGKFSVYLYGYKGLEASQGIIGSSNLRIHTTTGGAGGSYFIIKNLKAELSVDHTDYKELKNQFITSTFSLNYKF